MHLKVRRYKKDKDKLAVYIFVNRAGAELAYIMVEESEDGTLDVHSFTSKAAADALTYKMGQAGFMPDGREQIVDEWPNEELGDAPTGSFDFRTLPEPDEVWDDEDLEE